MHAGGWAKAWEGALASPPAHPTAACLLARLPACPPRAAPPQEAWAEHRAAQMAEGKGPASGLPQIVYSSRTHSQLQQVMKELKNCAYK